MESESEEFIKAVEISVQTAEVEKAQRDQAANAIGESVEAARTADAVRQSMKEMGAVESSKVARALLLQKSLPYTKVKGDALCGMTTVALQTKTTGPLEPKNALQEIKSKLLTLNAEEKTEVFKVSRLMQPTLYALGGEEAYLREIASTFDTYLDAGQMLILCASRGVKTVTFYHMRFEGEMRFEELIFFKVSLECMLTGDGEVGAIFINSGRGHWDAVCHQPPAEPSPTILVAIAVDDEPPAWYIEDGKLKSTPGPPPILAAISSSSGSSSSGILQLRSSSGSDSSSSSSSGAILETTTTTTMATTSSSSSSSSSRLGPLPMAPVNPLAQYALSQYPVMLHHRNFKLTGTMQQRHLWPSRVKGKRESLRSFGWLVGDCVHAIADEGVTASDQKLDHDKDACVDPFDGCHRIKAVGELLLGQNLEIPTILYRHDTPQHLWFKDAFARLEVNTHCNAYSTLDLIHVVDSFLTAYPDKFTFDEPLLSKAKGVLEGLYGAPPADGSQRVTALDINQIINVLECHEDLVASGQLNFVVKELGTRDHQREAKCCHLLLDSEFKEGDFTGEFNLLEAETKASTD